MHLWLFKNLIYVTCLYIFRRYYSVDLSLMWPAVTCNVGVNCEVKNCINRFLSACWRVILVSICILCIVIKLNSPPRISISDQQRLPGERAAKTLVSRLTPVPQWWKSRLEDSRVSLGWASPRNVILLLPPVLWHVVASYVHRSSFLSRISVLQNFTVNTIKAGINEKK